MTDPFEAIVAEWGDEERELYALVEQMMKLLPPEETMTAQDYRDRAASRPQQPRLAEASERTANGVPIRVFVPPVVNGVYLFIHGGGWIGGSRDAADPALSLLARQAGSAVVSVGYRLAPEHTYPAAHDDCESAALWTIESAVSEFGTDRIVIGGASAGAHLSACTLLRMRDRHGYTGFLGAELRYGIYDLRLGPGLRQTKVPILGAAAVGNLAEWAFPGADRDDPDLSPFMASLHDMPPALFTCGTADSLAEESICMWARWRAAGRDARLALYPGGVHAFDGGALPRNGTLVPTKQSQVVQADIAAFVRECIA